MGGGSTTASDLFSYFYGITRNNFSWYKETCKVIIDCPNIGGEDIKYHIKKAIRNLLHENIDVCSRRLIVEFSGDGVKLISKLQYHCANMTFAEKIRYDRIFQQVSHKGG